MFCKTRIAVYYVGFPKNRGEILWSSSNCSGCCVSTVIWWFEQVLWFSKVDDFYLSIIQKKQVCWFQITMAEPMTLHVRQSTDQRHHHLFHFSLFPEEVHLLPFPKHVFQIELVLDILADDADSESVVHCFIEEVTEELNDIWMVLSLEQLNGFFFIFIQLI